MGRKIRKVPKDWEHPKDDRGNFKPLYDEDYDSAAEEWLESLRKWEAGENKDRKKYGYRYMWDWDGGPPNKEYYRPKFKEEPTHYQIYETVSEGTPVSPVFESKEEMVGWLIKQGYSEKAALCFAESGWAPSMIFSPGKFLKSNIDACEEFPNCPKDEVVP